MMKKVPFNLFAAFPERQRAPQAQLPARVARGDCARIDLTQVPDGRIIRVWVIAPDGVPMTARHQVISRDQTTDGQLPFSYDDAAGSYRIEVTDVATGLTSHYKLNVY